MCPEMRGIMPSRRSEPGSSSSRRQRVLFGELAVGTHKASEEDLKWALAEQHRLRKLGARVPRVGELLVARQSMGTDDVYDLLRSQGERGKKLFGRLAVREELCSEEDLAAALERQKDFEAVMVRRPRIGEILVARGVVKQTEVLDILRSQGKRVVECPQCEIAYNATHVLPGSQQQCPSCKSVFVPIPGSDPALPAVEEDAMPDALGAGVKLEMPAFADRRRRQKARRSLPTSDGIQELPKPSALPTSNGATEVPVSSRRLVKTSGRNRRTALRRGTDVPTTPSKSGDALVVTIVGGVVLLAAALFFVFSGGSDQLADPRPGTQDGPASIQAEGDSDTGHESEKSGTTLSTEDNPDATVPPAKPESQKPRQVSASMVMPSAEHAEKEAEPDPEG